MIYSGRTNAKAGLSGPALAFKGFLREPNRSENKSRYRLAPPSLITEKQRHQHGTDYNRRVADLGHKRILTASAATGLIRVPGGEIRRLRDAGDVSIPRPVRGNAITLVETRAA